MAEALPPVFDAARDVTWLGAEGKKPRVDGFLRRYGRQIRELAAVLGVQPSDFISFPVDGNKIFLGAFASGSYDAIHSKAALHGFDILNEDQASLLAPQLRQLQDPDRWSFLQSDELAETGWVRAVRFAGDGLVRHNRSPHADSPFCGAWVFKAIFK